MPTHDELIGGATSILDVNITITISSSFLLLLDENVKLYPEILNTCVYNKIDVMKIYLHFIYTA